MERITKFEFAEFWVELNDSFNKNCKANVCDAYFKQVKTFDSATVKKAVSMVIRGDQYFPTIARLISACFENRTIETSDERACETGHCEGSGWVHWKEPGLQSTASACDCLRGQYNAKRYRVKTYEHFDEDLIFEGGKF